MSHCVPNWDLDERPNPPSSAPHAPLSFRSDYEVTELTWENGHLSEHGLGHPRRVNMPTPKYPSSETLEAIVNQAKLLPPPKPPSQITGAPAHHNDASPVPRTATTSAISSCSGAAGKKLPRPAVESGGVSWSPDSTRAADTFGTDDFTDGGGATGSPETENTSFCGGGARSRLLNAIDDHDTASHSRRSPAHCRET
ncbi:transcription factor UNE10 isoform X2 [Iris pallida]|uniref:Transcription factor UNE10 isoform X2 n=1 Tax=Iris pallida TaxID=29817 RepID=A0AAX6E023_IRIPA|nr:transcription factor UNE10 isoform X2 [Iris pallida]